MHLLCMARRDPAEENLARSSGIWCNGGLTLMDILTTNHGEVGVGTVRCRLKVERKFAKLPAAGWGKSYG